MDSLSYSFKKLLFSKREAPKANGRTGRERFRQSGQRDRRATSPFEEVDLEQYAKTKADLENDVELCSENQNENDIDPWSVDNGEDARRQRDYSGFEEIGVEIELYCGENEKDGLICGESESDQGVKDQKLETGGSSSNKPDYQSDLPGDFLKNDSKDSKDGSDHQNMDNTTSDNIEEVNQGLGETSEISDGIPVLSDVLKEELDSSEVNIRPKAERHKPLTREQFLTYFDSDGRMVVEHDVRRSIFKGGVEDDIRQEVWQFLFELYPCNSTKREREILKTENLIRYEALKARWKPLLQEIAKDAKVGFKFCPDWFGKKIQMAPSDAQDVAENQDSTFVRIDSKDEDYDENNEIEIKLNNSREESVNFVCDGESIRTMGPKAVDEHHDNPFLDSESEDDLEHDLNGDSEVRRDRKPDSNLENMIGSEVVKKRNNNPFLDSDSDDDARHDPHPDYELRTDQNPDYDLRQDQNLDHDVKRDQHSDSNGANNNPFLDSCDAEDSNETKSSQSDSSHEQTFDDDRLVFDSKEKDEQEIEEAIQEAMFDENYGCKGVVPEASVVIETMSVESASADEENDFCYIDRNLTEAAENECKLDFNSESEVVSDSVIAQKESSIFASGFEFQERGIRPESKDSTIEDESLQQELSNTEFREEEPVIKESDTRKSCVAQDDHDRDLLLNNRSSDSENLLLNTSVDEFQETDSALQELADFTFNTSTLQSQLSANDEDLSNQNLMEFSSNPLVFQEEPRHLEESDIDSENINFSNAEVDLSYLQQEVGVSTREDAEVSELFGNSGSVFPLRNSNLSTDNEVMIRSEDKGPVHISVTVVSQKIEKSDIVVEKIDKEVYQANYVDADYEHDSGRSHTIIDEGERSEVNANENNKDERSEVNTDQLITVETRSEVTSEKNTLVNSEICDLRTAGVDFKNEYANDMNPSIIEENSGNVFPGFDANLNRGSNPDNLDSDSNLIADIFYGYNENPDLGLGEKKSVCKLKEDFRSVDQESLRITPDIDNGSIVNRDALNLDLNSTVTKDIHHNTSYMPPWLAQQIKASSPAGTKISKTLHIHAEGLSLVEEDTSHVVPLREITEKASLAVKQQLTESRPPVRSSTPVFSDYPEENEDEGTGEKDVGDGCTEEIEKEAESNDDVMGGSHEFTAKESGELDGPGVFACDVSQITDMHESEAANQNEATQNRVLTRKISKDDSSIVRNPQLLSRGLRKAQSVSNITDFTIIENSIAQIQKSITASDQKISKSESHISRPDSRNYTSPLPDIIEDGHSNCPYCGSDYQEPVQIPDGFGEDWRRSIEIQAKVYAGRQSYNIQDVCKALRIIDKDVPRTDRELPYFSGNDNINLLKLRDALISYSFFHPDVGYAQGMNDIMSRFFVVMDSEADAYWMFCNYMEHFKGDFMEKDMLRKINLVEQLLMKMDRELYDFLQELQMELIFCHRWLLLSFKREFSYEDGLRIFEIMSSRHLEVSSIEAEMERSRERARELEKDEGSRMEEIYVMPEYSFDVFLCVAMLHECRDALMETDDMASIYQTIASLPQINDLNVILSKAEDLFYQYCRKSTLDCFQLIDEPIHRTPSWKQRLHLDF